MQENKTAGVIGTVVVLVAVAGVIGYAALRPATVSAPATTTTATSTLPDGNYTEHAEYYDITASYATSTPLERVANMAALTLIQDFVNDTISQFKTDGNFANLTAQDIKMMGFDQGRKETLEIKYLMSSSPRTISYIFTTYEDTLGAHGNTFFHTFTFDTKTGAALALKDVFTPGVDYLGTLSKVSRARLPGVIGENFDITAIKDGTTPEEKSFQNFFFDGRDFVILFDPYAVAAYAAGPQTLRIPVSALSILKPEYQ